MELELLKRRAEKITGDKAGNSAGGGLDNEFRLLLDASFNCSGTMTGLLLVGTVNSIDVTNKLYPEIQLWRITDSIAHRYSRQTRQEIIMSAGDFSPDGVLQYNLTTPILFQSGDVLGVYQPMNSVVRVYYDDSMQSETYKLNMNPPDRYPSAMITLFNQSIDNEKLILISPILGNY